MHKRRARSIGWLILVADLCLATPAWALQPLETFVVAARTYNPQVAGAEANAELQRGNVRTAAGHLLPGLAVRGSYVRNEFEAALPAGFAGPNPIILQPYNQWTATITLNVPLIDLASFSRYSAAQKAITVSEEQIAAAQLQTESLVTQQFYQLLAYMALRMSADHALDVAQQSLRLTEDRLAVGSAAKLDVDRARADVQAQFQQVAEVKLQIELLARSLESLTGVTADFNGTGDTKVLNDDLHPETSADFQTNDLYLPTVHAAMLNTELARQNANAERWAFLPTVAGFATETLGNVPNFIGKKRYYAAGFTLTWNLDVTSFGNLKTADATEQATRIAERKARLDAHDNIYRYVRTVDACIVRSRSAREQASVRASTAALSQERYAAGTATHLELLQAQRDAFAADVGRIQADADLVNARAQLRIAAGIARDL